VAGEATHAGTTGTPDMPAAEAADMAATETAADVAAAEPSSMTAPAAVTSAAMLSPERDRKRQSERHNGGQATHTNTV